MILKRLRRQKGYSCHEVLEVLQSYIDGEVDEATAQKVAKHLDMCTGCTHEADVFRKIEAAVFAKAEPIDPAIIDSLTQYAMKLGESEPNLDDSTHD